MHRASTWRPPTICLILLTLLTTALTPGNGDVGSPGDAADYQGLLSFKEAIPNFAINQRRGQYSGWSHGRGTHHCTWAGVTCANGNVVGLQLLQNASWHRGDIGQVLQAASLLAQLKTLDLSRQAFTGTLPSISIPTLETLNLADNTIQGTIPADWGLKGAFPQLANLTLSFNPALGGTLPQAWGLNNTSLQSLRVLEVNNCNVTGTLPAAWCSQLPALRQLNASSNFITGTLPSQWSSMDLVIINLDRNALTGTIPSVWGSNGTFARLRKLQLFGNHLSGTLPDTWASVNGSRPLPSCGLVDVAGNSRLGGIVPDGWGKPGTAFLITRGNRFCGRPPASSYIILSCGLLRAECTKQGAIYPNCLTVPRDAAAIAPPPGAATVSNSGDRAVLLSLKQAFWNWANVEHAEEWMWDPALPMCASWHGVTCSPDGHVTGLNLSTTAPTVPIISPLQYGYDDSIVHGSRAAQLQGKAVDVLQVLSKLPQLRQIDLSYQYLYGTLPANISFASLAILTLATTYLTGNLPGEWGSSGSFPALKQLDVSGTRHLGGPLPAAWGSQPNSMGSLQLLMAGDCNMTGTLPAAWALSLPALRGLDVSNSNLSGTLPPSWQSIGSMTALDLSGNSLQGMLPQQWSSGGPSAAWASLKELHLEANLLQGTLPDSWGSGGSFPAITNITLESNSLTGTVPASWGAGPNGSTAFKALPSVTLRPGNAALCGEVPSGLQVYSAATGSQAPQTLFSLDKCPPRVSNTAASDAGMATTGRSASTGAIVGGIVGGCAFLGLMAAAAWIFVMARRKRQKRQDDLHMAPDRHSSLDGKVEALMGTHELHQKSGSPRMHEGCPPASNTVPFLQAPSSRGSLAPSSQSSSGGLAGQQSDGSSRSPLAGQAGGARRSGSGSQDPGVLGEGLLQLAQRDWQLNLDALEIELDEAGKEVELGRGAFGVVVKGWYRLMPVAIKRLLLQSPEQQAAFLKEMAILRACRGSRYIVPFVGASLLPGNTILAMDFMESGSLWDLLPRTNKAGQRPFQFQNRGKKIAYEVALGLHFIHELKVVHLDLKSCNVLIAGDGTAKISDVGLALLIRDRYLSSTAPAGTFSWVAPEVILGGHVSKKADIFSFGVVLWEIVTLERPTWRGNLRRVRVPEECPQEIADLIASCTADAAERPDAEECAHIIAQFVPSADARRSASRSLSGRSPRPLLKASGRAASGDSTESGAATSPAGASGHGGMLPAAAAPGTEQHREHTAGIPSGEVTPDGQIVPGSPATPEGSQGCGKRPHPQASTPALKVDGASR